MGNQDAPAANFPNFKTRPGIVRPRLKVGIFRSNSLNARNRYDENQKPLHGKPTRSTGTRATNRSITPRDYFAENDDINAMSYSNDSEQTK